MRRFTGSAVGITLLSAAFVTTGAGEAAAQETFAGHPVSSDARWRGQMVALVNAERDAVGVPRLLECQSLTSAADRHSADMAANEFLDHDGSDGSKFYERMHDAGYMASNAAENVATLSPTQLTYPDGGVESYDLQTPANFFAMWMESSGHRENIRTSYYRHIGVSMRSSPVVSNDVGAGYSTKTISSYSTQVFGYSGHDDVGCQASPIGAVTTANSPAKGSLRVAGWAGDADTSAAIQVQITVDGITVSTGPTAAPNTVVSGWYPTFSSTPGFNKTFSVTPGMRQVCATALNVGGGSDTPLGCRSVWVPDPASPFVDVLSTDAFFDEIVWLHDAGMTTGYPDGTFRPTGIVSRQAMVALLWREAGSPSAPAPDFTDVGLDHPFRTAIGWAAAEGIANGYADKTFKPGNPVSRQAMMAILWRSADSPPAPDPTFDDIGTDHPFRTAIGWATSEGITTGYPDSTFRPANPVSRQAMAAFLYRA